MRKKRLKISKIHHILISHLHGDHFFGLVGLISSLNLFGRTKDLHIYSDPRIKEVIDLQLEVSETELQFNIVYHPLNFKEKELIFEDKKLEIYSFPLDHRVPTCGFLFREKQGLPNIKKEIIREYNPSIQEIQEIREGGDLKLRKGKIPNEELIVPAPPPRSYAYCSDTRYTPEIHKNFEDVELLYAECTFMKDMQKVAEEKYHMSTSDVSQLARECNSKKLIVGHFSARYKDLSEFDRELNELHPGSALVNDLEEYHVREE